MKIRIKAGVYLPSKKEIAEIIEKWTVIFLVHPVGYPDDLGGHLHSGKAYELLLKYGPVRAALEAHENKK
jgi:hypothetical protein